MSTHSSPIIRKWQWRFSSLLFLLQVMVEVLDTAGTEQYSSMHQLYIDHGQVTTHTREVGGDWCGWTPTTPIWVRRIHPCILL